MIHSFIPKVYSKPQNRREGSVVNTKLLEPLPMGPLDHGPVDLKSYWPPKKSTGPQFFSNDVSPSKTVVDIKTLLK